MNKTDLEERTLKFSLALVRLLDDLPRNRSGDVVGRQLLRSGTSIGANYREANRAESRDDFILLAIKSKNAPMIEITGEGSAAYIWFDRGAKFARTVARSTWPVLNVDLDQNDCVIGIEAIGYKEFSIEQLLHEAGVVVAGESIEQRAMRASKEKFVAALANAPDVPPAENDRLT